MRLKKIKLAGFKSFVDPTTIPFPGDMTAIVGPNGCGKSNVIDAVRWVLGESSAKNLRGDAMTDVIFNGSSARKPVGQCSVELVFDNTSGRVQGEFANYNELSVKRLVTRDAQSNYFLNGTKCRRRDVTDLFLGTGLGPRSYAIIEQGMISRLIESKPQELRVFIEEAAGISKYKERRRETENRIRHTQDNLERLEDVRGELGKQLEKLQRQAAAAKRYKTLKAEERTLKGELAALRWLRHSEQVDKLEKDQQHQQNELDALTAQQRGDEAGIEKYRSQSDTLKTQVDDLQQALFNVGTQITRIEQNAVHSQQREKQINAELDELANKRNLLASSMSEAKSALATAVDQLMAVEPELEMLAATIEQAQDNQHHADNALREFNRRSREHENQFHTLKQQVQNCHSQIQSTTSMQLRTTQRIAEIEFELEGLASDELHSDKAKLEDDIALQQEKLDIAAIEVESAEDALDEAKGRRKESENTVNRIQGESQQLESKIATLEMLQQQAEQRAATLPEGVSALWQRLRVKPGHEEQVEKLTGYLDVPIVASDYELDTILASLDHFPGGHTLFPASSNVPPAPGTLAECLEGGYIPDSFHSIFLVENLNEARQRIATLSAGESLLTQDGVWISQHWARYGDAVDNEAGAIQRQAQLASLQHEKESVDVSLEAAQALRHSSEQKEQEAAQYCEEIKASRHAAQSKLASLKSRLEIVALQRQHQQEQQQKLTAEKHKQVEVLAQEDAQLEALSAKLEALEEDLMAAEEDAAEAANQREMLENQVTTTRQSVENHTARRHQLELTIQQQKNQQQLYQQQVTRNEHQLAEYEARETALREERQALSQPMEMQQEQLETLLNEREDLEARRIEKQNALSEVDALLREAQQGQQGIASQIQQRQSVIDGLNVDIEGARVRAMTVLEQLEETGISLKQILENLSDEAEEKRWQDALEKTTAAVGRLGAVNLAAVEEYDIQAERKGHLDAQYDDLIDALDTLQTAIRKIDKETKSRFSNTFEQVNEDLKQLFPKVFGGGSAYLTLTDDDLLETGVTIMARPPGKKNSTIHLLSGGEKALTALSLVFAIFRLNPAPFCLLDEVDAPLDDANVGRFCKLVSEMSQSVQFIYITHNKIAMEMATHLTGVTMAEPGVSRMVAVDVDEAMAFVDG